MKQKLWIAIFCAGIVSGAQPLTPDKSADKAASALSDPTNANYVLGPGDQIAVRVMNFEEAGDKPITIDLDGSIRMPVIGRVPAAGMTATKLERDLAQRLQHYLRQPDVSITVTEFRSQPVSILGAVKNPGVHQVQGHRTLVEVISLAGGLADTAGTTVHITRELAQGRIPLAGAKDDESGRFSTAEISLKSIIDAKNPDENILVEPHDVISVPKADTVYVIGQVPRPGGFALNEHEQVTVLQALSMAGGLDHMAQPKDAKLLRRVPGETARTEIAVNLRNILNGSHPDMPMRPDDILFVPDNLPKKAAARALEAAIQMGTGVVIWRRP